MKKTLLHISMLLDFLYILLLLVIVLFQDALKPMFGITEKENMVFIFPGLFVVEGVVFAVIILVLALPFVTERVDENTSLEMIVLVICTIILAFRDQLLQITTTLERATYTIEEWDGIYNYSIVSGIAELVQPIWVVSMVLLMIYAGISMGRKQMRKGESISENTKEN